MPTAEWSALLQDHDELVDAAIAANRGVVVKHEGDGTFAAFETSSDAIGAAIDLSRAITVRPWPKGATVRLRIGIHTGAAELTRDGSDYLGLDVHYAARLPGAGNGGQILLSEAARATLVRPVPDDTELVSAGPRRLKDFDEARPIHRLIVPGAADDARPL